MKQPRTEVVGNVQEVINRRTQSAKAAFLICHVLQPILISCLHLCATAPFVIGQHMRGLVYQRIRLLQWRPYSRGRLQRLLEQLL